VASGGKDRTVDLVDLSTGKLVHRLPGLNDSFSSVATSSDGKRFATATIDRVFANHLPANEASFETRYNSNVSDDANIGRPQPSEVRIWSTGDGRLQTMLPLRSSQVTAIDFIPQNDQVAVAGWLPGKGGMLSLWDANDGSHLRDFAAHSAEVLSLAASPDGRALASGDADGNLELWDLQSGKKTRSHKLDHAIEAVTFSVDGRLLATGDGDRTVCVFDASDGKIARTLKSRSYIESLDFSPDATLLAAGTRDPGLELWDLRADAPSRTLAATGDHFDTMPGFVAFSPDGRFVVCGGHGKDIAVFDAAKSTLHCELRGHAHPATAAVFLPDGRLVSGGEDRTLMLWNPNRRNPLATWVAAPADESRNWGDEWVGFSPSGQFVGSTRLERLVGWQSGGEVVIGAEDADRRRRVESLFQVDGSTLTSSP
jgi:WD40 repeat protein